MEQQQKVLTDLLNSYTPLTGVSLSAVLSKITYTLYRREEYIIREEKNDGREYFLLEGISHRFNITEDGKEVTTGFYCAPSVVVPHFSRTIKHRSIFSIQALTDCILAHVPVEEFDMLRYAHQDIGKFGNAVVERELSRNLLEDTIFRSCNAKQRLLLMRTEYPNLENIVPHHVIATFLGITPVSFSRLRNELSSPG